MEVALRVAVNVYQGRAATQRDQGRGKGETTALVNLGQKHCAALLRSGRAPAAMLAGPEAAGPVISIGLVLCLNKQGNSSLGVQSQEHFWRSDFPLKIFNVTETKKLLKR